VSLIEFIDLGKQPLANGFMSHESLHTDWWWNRHEPFYSLRAGFDASTCLVSLMEFVDSHLLFNDNYAYCSSGSQTMRDHFLDMSRFIKERFEHRRVLEIGSNDGVFLQHFPGNSTVAVEPCGNFADITRKLGYTTHADFWTMDLARQIREDGGPVDLVYAANCMCHIPNINAAFAAVEYVLADDGVFIFEDPSLYSILRENSYDQIYDEHAHLFSAMAMHRMLGAYDLVIWRIDCLPVHGGSYRFYVKKACAGAVSVEDSVRRVISAEYEFGLGHEDTFFRFAERVELGKYVLIELLHQLKNEGNKIIGYGATSKSTVVYNYCGIGPDLIEYVVDTTETKQGMFTPGTHIPIVSPEVGMDDSVDYAFLGAWNFKDEIVKKETAFRKRGGKFITHVPMVRVI